MRIFIASHEPSIATVLRGSLAGQGIECSLARTLNLDDAARTLADMAEPIDALLVVLPESREGAFETIKKFRLLTDAWVIAVGRAETPRDVLDVLRYGADDFIDRDGELTEQVAAILQSPRMLQEAHEKHSSHILGVTSASGGSGGSTIAVNLAVSMADLAGKCGLFDLDLEKGDLAYLLNVTPRHTIAELCRTAAGLDRNMLDKSLVTHASGVSLLAGSGESSDQTLVDTNQLSRILDLGSGMFPCCVVDFGRQAGGMRHLDLLRKCDRILIVLKLDFTGVCNARRMLDALERERIDIPHVMLVVNRRGMPAEISPNRAETILGRDVDHCIPNDEMTSNFCVNCGTPYTLEAPRKGIAKALRILAKTLANETDAASTTPVSTDVEASGFGNRRTLRLLQQAAGLLLCMRTARW